MYSSLLKDFLSDPLLSHLWKNPNSICVWSRCKIMISWMYSGNESSMIPEYRDDRRGKSKGRGENVFRSNSNVRMKIRRHRVHHENPQMFKKSDQNGSWWKKLEHFEIDHQNSVLSQNLQMPPAQGKHTVIFLPCHDGTPPHTARIHPADHIAAFR